MKRILLIQLTALLASITPALASVLSGAVYNPTTTHTYYLLTPSPWTSAESQAVALGGHLVTVNDSVENSWLLSTFSNFGGQSRALWLGLNDTVSEGTYVWSSGESSLFTNWETGQPDNGGGVYPTEDYILAWPSPGPRSPGKWNDYIDSSTFPDMSILVSGVVEVPEPNCGILLASGLLWLVRARLKTLRSLP